jgi:hypothetical protein
MFSIPMPIDFTQATESFAKSIVQAANERAAKLFSDHYGLPFDEVLTHLIGEVQLSKEEIILPPNKLPFCGRAGLKEGKCKGIVKNQGLFTLCQKNVKDDGYCSTCGKQAAKDGSPLNGDIDARESCEIDKYSVGKFVAKPYWCFMQKHNITEEQANASAMFHYGVTIDPIHFKPVTIARGRRATTEMKMGTPLEVLHMPDASDEVAEAAKAAEAEVAAEIAEAAKADEAEVAAEVAEAAKAGKAKTLTELEEGELDEEEVDDEVDEVDDEVEEEVEVTAYDINSMVMEELQKFAESRGIPITENGKKLPPKKLRKNVCEQLQL